MSEIITSSIEISAGIVFSGLTVDAGGEVTVLSGGTVTDAEAINYGYFWVEEGGYIGNIRVTNSGDAMVNGGLAENLTMESGGMADIFGGTMRTGTILNGGYGAVYEGGSGLDVAVSSGGRYLVYGGYAENTVVSNGGSFTVQLSGGLASKTTVEAGGHARIVSGGKMRETILNGGRLDVISGTVKATTVNGGELHVSSGGPELASGYAENTVVNAGSFIVSGATAASTTVNSGGSFLVSGGTAQTTTVNNGGDFIATDATVQSTTVSGGSFVASHAAVQSTTVSGGAVRFIGGTADKTDIFSGTVLVSGGTVQNTTLGSSTGGSINIPIVGPTFTPFDPHNPIILNPINWDDIILVDDGGTATITYGTGGSILLDGGATVYTPEQRETIGYAGYPGQTVNGDEASAGEEEPACRLDILNGGLAVSTTVNSGLMQVFEGGAANETTVKGGTLHISGGGIANNITMSGGGGGRYSIIVGGDTNTYGDAISFNPVPSGSGTPFVTVFEGGTANNITVSGGLLTLDGGTANNVTLAGGTFHVSSGGIANKTTIKGGTATVFDGGRISGATVTGGTVRFLEGGTLAGPFTVTASADVYMESGSVIAFDITAMTPGAEAESSGMYYIWGAPSFTLTISDIQAAGVYALSAEAAGFRDAITVQSQLGVQLGTLTVGNTAFLNDQYYTLRVTDNVLNLTVSNEAPARMWAPAMVFVNAAWSSLPEGSTVEPVAGLTATIGVDAFATGREGTNAAAGDGTVVVVGGEASFQYGITCDTAAWNGASVTGSTVLRNGALTLYAGSTGNDLTVTRDGKLFVNAGATGNTLNVTSGGDLAVSGVARGIRVQNGGTLTVKAGGVCSGTDISGTLVVEAGGYLTGTGKFASGASITVNGIINFDLTCLSSGNSALFTGNGTSIAGAPSFTIMVSDSQATGTYSLADRIPDLDGLFTILNVRGEAIGTLTVGSGILLDGRAYMLRRDGTGISLTISEAGDTNVLYVNTDWAEIAPGAVVETPSGAAIIGYDAFGDLHTAEERLPEDGFIIITGGTYASETISIGITMEGGTISGSAITATGSLTMNNSSGAANLTVDGALVMNSRAKASDLTVNGRLVMNDSSEAENITVTGSIMLNGNSKATNLTAKGMAVVRGADNARLDGTITIGSGATLTGAAEFGANSELVIDGKWDFDISGTISGNQALFRSDNMSMSFSSTAQLVITVSDTQTGLYSLASGIAGLENAVFTVVNTSGATVAMLAAGESITVNGKYYRLSCAADNGPLALTVANEPNAYRTYVNSVWRDKSFGDLVQTPDGAVVFGVNAFADLDTAQLSTSEYGTVFVVGGTFDSGSITRNVQVSDTSVANLTVSGYGTLTLNSGATARDITVSAGSLLTVNAGATLTVAAPGFFDPDAVITIHGNLLLDISGTTPGDPALIDASRLPEGSTIKVDIGSSPASGVYSLVSGMTEFNGVEIYRNGVYFKTLSALNKEDLTFSTMFSMTLTTSEEDPTLRLVLKQYLNYYPCVNTEWAGLDYGTAVVSPDGYTYTFGYDAFATYEEAEFVTLGSSPGMIMIYAENNCISPAGGINKTSSLRQGRIENTAVGISGSLTLGADTSAKNLVVDGKLIASSRNIMQNVVVNGTLEYSGESTGPQQDITVTESGTLTGWTTFAEDCGFTVDGYLQFSLGSYSGSSDDQNSVQYRNLYNLKGNTKYSVSIGSDTYSNQRYTLATGFAGSEDTSFVFVNPRGRYLGEIRLGKSAIVEKNVFTMTVEKDETTGEDCLMLTITQKGETLYLSSEWEGVEDGKEVQYPVMYGQIWGTAVMGESAFSDGDLAMEKAYGIDTIRICCGTFSFSEGITTQTLVSGSHTTGDVLIRDTEIAASLTITGADDTTALTGRNLTVWDCGSLSAGSGALLDSITVRSGGQVSVGGGAMLTGRCVFEDGSGIKLESNASLIFDITGMTAGGPAQYEGFGCVQWKQSATPLFTLAISGTQEYGDYLLATGVTGFTKSVSITVDGVQAGSVSTAEKTILNGTTYALKIQDGSLILRVAEYVQPSVVYLNSEWKKTPADTAVEVPGGTAVIGYDAFADMTKALSAAGSGGTVAITGGTFRFADGIDSDILLMNGAVHDSTVRKTLTVEAGASASNLVVSAGAALTVEAGAKLTGWGVFAEGAAITIDGTLDFDISAKMAGITYLYSGLSFVQGSTNFTLTVRDFQSLGLYALADGLTEFGSTITVVNTTGTQLGKLSVGTTTRIGGKAYRLMLNDGVLSVALLTPEEAVKCDVNGNGISDVLFQYTGGRNQTGYWLDGKDEWRSSNELHPVEWTLLGAYDMDGDGLADSVFVGNTVVNGVKGAYIGYYAGGVDADENWRNIDFLNNEAENVWENKIGNLTGNPGANSIVWHCAGLGAIGVWTDGTSNWISLGGGFDSNWTMVGCGDFDGDGRDSVVMSYLGGAKYYAIGINGSAVDMGSLNWAGWEVRAIGDFAGDGRDDMVLFHKELGALVMLADGNVDNYTAVGMLDAKDWFIVGAGDYDGDKQDDLLVRQYSTGMLGYYSSGDVARWNVLGYGVSMDWTVIA